MIRKILSDKWYVPVVYAGIDYDKWTDSENYFSENYELPPMLDPEDRTGILLGQLTARQMRQVQSMMPDEFELTNMPLDLVDYIVRYGVKDWRELKLEDESGAVETCAPTFEEGPNGRRLTAEAYDILSFFYSLGVCRELAARIFLLSRS